MNKNLNARVKRRRDHPWGRNLSGYDDGQEKMLDQCVDELEAALAADADNLTPENIVAIEEGMQQSRDGKVVEMDFSVYVQAVSQEMVDAACISLCGSSCASVVSYSDIETRRRVKDMLEAALANQPKAKS